MASPSGGASRKERLATGFNQATSSLGGRDAVAAVRDLVGNCARFDFPQVGKDLPQVDLPALRPFFAAPLALHSRRPTEDKPSGSLSFLTPDTWKSEPGVKSRYDGMVFDRCARGQDARSRILGVGHKLVDLALADAKSQSANVCSLPPSLLSAPLVAFEIHDRVTGGQGAVKRIIVGVEIGDDGTPKRLLRDWELLERLNALGSTRQALQEPSPRVPDARQVSSAVGPAQEAVKAAMDQMNLPFRVPEAGLLGVMWVEVTMAGAACFDASWTVFASDTPRNHSSAPSVTTVWWTTTASFCAQLGVATALVAACATNSWNCCRKAMSSLVKG